MALFFSCKSKQAQIAYYITEIEKIRARLGELDRTDGNYREKSNLDSKFEAYFTKLNNWGVYVISLYEDATDGVVKSNQERIAYYKAEIEQTNARLHALHLISGHDGERYRLSKKINVCYNKLEICLIREPLRRNSV